MGSGNPLWGRSVLVLEDEPLIALELLDELRAAGASIIAARRWLSWARPEVDESAATPVVAMLPRRAEPPLPSTNPVPEVHDRASLVRALQYGLKRAGCYHGQITGEWTRESRKAMRALTIHLNAQLPVEAPDDVLLALVEGQPDNICNAACPSGEALAGDGRCLSTALLAKDVPAPRPFGVTVTERAMPESTIRGRASTTNGWPNATIAPAIAPLEGRMALAGPKSPTAAALPAPRAPIRRQYVSRAAASTRTGFSASFFKRLDRMGNL